MLDRPHRASAFASAADAAPLLMLPGTLCDARLFAPVLDRLSMTAEVPALAGAETAAALAQLILASAPHTISLCGFSLGAIVALEIVAQAPERVERLALIGCNPGALDAQARTARATIAKSEFLDGETSPHREMLKQMAVATTDACYAQQTQITLSRGDSRSRLGRIAVPTLVVCGAEDRICPPALSEEIAAAVPGAHLAIIPDASHYVTLDAPDAVAAELAAWLAAPSPLQN